MAAHRSLVAALFALTFCLITFVGASSAAAQAPTAASAASTLEPAAMIPAQAPPATSEHAGIGTWLAVAGAVVLAAGVIVTVSSGPVGVRHAARARCRVQMLGIAA